MHRRIVSTSIALASAAALSFAALNCGGPQINMEQLASSPGMHTVKAFSITVAGQTVSYKHGESEASYDPSTRVLSLYISGDVDVDQDWLQHTTCDFASYTQSMMGNYVIVRFKDFDPNTPGTVTATDADFVTQTGHGSPPTTKKGAVDGATLTVTKTNNDRIVGTFSGTASGAIDAWPCFVDGGPGGAPTPAPAASSAAPADSAAAPASSSAAPAPADAGADDTSTPAPGKKKKKKKSGG